MQLERISLEQLVGELEELPSDWTDEKALALVAHVKISLGRLRALDRPLTEQDLADELRDDVRFLEICRLFLGKGQEPAAHVIGEALVKHVWETE